MLRLKTWIIIIRDFKSIICLFSLPSSPLYYLSSPPSFPSCPGSIFMVYSAESCRLVQSVQEVSQELIPDQHATQGVHCCYVDGSFREPSEGGAAYILFDSTGTELEFLQYGLMGCQPYSTFHMEAAALLLEMKAVMFRSLTSLTICKFLTD